MTRTTRDIRDIHADNLALTHDLSWREDERAAVKRRRHSDPATMAALAGGWDALEHEKGAIVDPRLRYPILRSVKGVFAATRANATALQVILADRGLTPDGVDTKEYELWKMALTVLDAQAGGYVFGDTLAQKVLDATGQVAPIARLARVVDCPGDTLPVPSVAMLLGEARDATDTTTVAQRRLTPLDHRATLRLSKALHRAPLAAEFLPDALGRALAAVEESEFLYGRGVGEALGVLADPTIPATETTTAEKLDTVAIRAWRYALPAVHLGAAQIIAHPQFVTAASRLGFAMDDGTLLGAPLHVTDAMPQGGVDPDIQEEGAAVAVIGDWRYYWIARRTLWFQVAVERRAEANEDAFWLHDEVDGMPVLPRAFRVLRIAEAEA